LSCLTNRRRVRLVHTFHFGNYPHVPRRYLLLEAVGARAADRLIAVGIEQARAIRQTFRLREADVDVIVNGAGLAAVPIDEPWRDHLRQDDAVVIGTICTFIEQKGLPDLLRVAAVLRNTGVNARFVVVGDGPLRASVEEQTRALNLTGYVLFAGLKDGASSSMLPLFDVFFQPSLWEAMSMVVIEAMAAGKPVVATDVGDNRHVIAHGISGWIVPKGDVPAMARALGQLIASPLQRREFGEAGRRRYGERYTVETMVRAHERLYEDVLAS
jgi:glycosyltransferase involved in cell wall biosynthesis